MPLKDSGYQYSIAGAEWQPLPKTDEWQESRVLNRHIILDSKEEQLECHRTNGHPCSEPEQHDTDLLDADAAKLMAVVRGMRALTGGQSTDPAGDG